MSERTECKNCGFIFPERDPGHRSDVREPCPRCGATSRNLFVTVADAIKVEASVSVNFESLSGTSNPTLLLQSVFTSSGASSEGQIIVAVSLPWFEIVRALQADPQIAFQISDRKWEEIIAAAYKQAKFDEVILTPRSGDLGRDVIATKKGIGTIRVIDQVKAYRPGHFVTANDVRALIGVLHGDGASKGFLTTTSDFAPRLREDPLIVPFMPARLELINGEALRKRLLELL